MSAPISDRRQCLRQTIEWANIVIDLTVGFGPDGVVREIFLQPLKSYRSTESTAKDGAVAISHLMRHGMRLSDLAQRFTPDEGGITPASLFTLAVARALELERAFPEEARQFAERVAAAVMTEQTATERASP